jgi:flagellar assembly protein FliH
MSTIIKAGSEIPRQSGLQVAPLAFNLDDMNHRANDYLEKIRAQAGQILREAQQQADSIRKQAESDGKRTAQQHAEKLIDNKLAGQMQTLLPALQQVVQQLAQAKQVWQQRWERDAVSVAIQIAERVIRREIAARPQITVDLVREALDLATGSSEITILLNPQDVQSLGTEIEKVVSSMRAAGTARIVGDGAISPGGCRVETRFGSIDQQLEVQLKRIEEELSQ